MSVVTASTRIDYRRPKGGAMRNALATVNSAADQTPRERSAHDYYREPAWAVEALLQAERFVGSVWDPACGSGTIPEVCKRFGLTAMGSDLIDRGYPNLEGEHDFLGPDHVDPVDNVICNPPFEHAERFIQRALGQANHKVAMLLRWSFCEGGTGRSEKSKLRRWALEEAPLSRVYVFAPRVSMPPGESTVEPKGGAVAFGWFVWSKDWRGPAQFGRLHRPAPPNDPIAEYGEACRGVRANKIAAGELRPIPGLDMADPPFALPVDGEAA